MSTQYTYQPLDSVREEIRVITLHPGRDNDKICISIIHSPFKLQSQVSSPSISKMELQASLPRPWSASETLEGKIIYHCEEEDGTMRTSWSHPGSSLNVKQRPTQSPELDKTHSDFEALSYTWGSLDDLDVVMVLPNQGSSQQPSVLKVGPNLYNVLKQLRSPDTARMLWIDALSINQEDLIERSKQVKRMRHIYTHARRVIVWLGKSESSSDLALQTLEYLGKQLEYTSSYEQLPAPDCSEKGWWKERGRMPFSSEAWEAIAVLIQRPWFERLWVVQEIQLANASTVIQCGNLEVPWYYLRRAFIKCRSMSKVVPQLSSSTIQNKVVHLWYLSTDLTKCRASMLFRIAGKCKCSDPRDKVYALMALLPQTLTAKIEPQYSLSVCEVFMQMMLASIANTQRLNLICFQGEKTSGQNLPSWVPNLAGIKAEYRKIPWATASGSSAAHSMFVHPNQLHVSGVSYTTIEAVHTEKWSDLASASRLAWQCWFGNKETEIYPTGEHTDEVYTWTLSCGRFRERWPQSVVVPTFTDARAIFQQLRDDHDVNEIDKHDSWLNEISHTLNGHQFFRCKEGYVGWGHEDAQVGDQVCIILGYQHPILLRPVQNGLFKIIGRCYVHGVIDAQAVLGPLPRPWRVVLRRSTWFDGASSLVERYVNSETHEETPQDPRLGELPETWEEIEKEDSTGIGFMVQHYKNRETNETINSDPRLLPHALKARGITLETFALV